jgi:hypothetical protein
MWVRMRKSLSPMTATKPKALYIVERYSQAFARWEYEMLYDTRKAAYDHARDIRKAYHDLHVKRRIRVRRVDE